MARKTPAASRHRTAAWRCWLKPRWPRVRKKSPTARIRKTRPTMKRVVLTMCIVFPSRPLPRQGEGHVLLAGQALVIIGALQLDLLEVGRVVGLDAAGEAGALHGLG